MYYFYDTLGGWFYSSEDTIYLISTIFAICVITVKNPIVSVLFLIGLFLTIGSYLIIIGVGFIGLSYLLVYVGAVSILFLFILMLINVRVSELSSDTKNSIPLVFLVILLFGNISYLFLPQESTISSKFFWDHTNHTFANFLINWDSYLASVPHIVSIGNIMYSTFAIFLLQVSIILLLAMVGAIIINIKQKNINYKEVIIEHSTDI